MDALKRICGKEQKTDKLIGIASSRWLEEEKAFAAVANGWDASFSNSCICGTEGALLMIEADIALQEKDLMHSGMGLRLRSPLAS